MFQSRWSILLLATCIIFCTNAEEGEVKPDAKALCDCDVIASTPETSSATWRYEQEPAEDCLDEFAVFKTGCSYTALQVGTSHATARVGFGSGFTWRGAVRAVNATVIRLQWRLENGSHTGYTFYIGPEDNSEIIMHVWETWEELGRKSTPAVLSAARYVPFYVTVDAEGVLRFGRECDAEPLFLLQTPAAEGSDIRVQVQPYSPYGGKFLFCQE